MFKSATQENHIRFLNKHTTASNEFKMHSHSCYEIIYFLSSGKIAVDGVHYPVEKGTCCIVPPNTEHKELLDGYGEILFIGFEWTEGSLFSKICIDITDPSFPLIFDKIIEEYSAQSYGYEMAAEALLKLLLIAYIRISGKEGKKCKDINYIKTYIEQYYNQKINFGELTQLSGYNYDYFRYLFKQKFGCSPQKYMINIRLDHARQLLETTNLSCTEIAYNCGFSTSAQMTTMIKRKFGQTPKRIQKHRFV